MFLLPRPLGRPVVKSDRGRLRRICIYICMNRNGRIAGNEPGANEVLIAIIRGEVAASDGRGDTPVAATLLRAEYAKAKMGQQPWSPPFPPSRRGLVTSLKHIAVENERRDLADSPRVHASPPCSVDNDFAHMS